MFEEKKYRFLIQQHKNRIYSYSLFMLKDKMDADDVTQEVMIRIWQNVDKFNVLAAKTWIMKTTNNLCIDYLRKRSAAYNRNYSISEEMEDSFGSELTEHNPFLTTHLKMITSKVKEVIQNLPDNLKSVFILYEIQGMKYREISLALDIPINSVKVYLLRARKKLQEDLKDYDTK